MPASVRWSVCASFRQRIYLHLVHQMRQAVILLDDLGGFPECAQSLGKLVLVMRDTSERTEAVGAGTVELGGTDGEQIGRGTAMLLDDQGAYEAMSRAHNSYGYGFASQRIRDAVLWFFAIEEDH